MKMVQAQLMRSLVEAKNIGSCVMRVVAVLLNMYIWTMDLAIIGHAFIYVTRTTKWNLFIRRYAFRQPRAMIVTK